MAQVWSDTFVGALPLSVLVDNMRTEGLAAAAGADANQAPRDQDFVRYFAAWLAERAAHLKLALVDRFELEDVVVTFHMRERVKLVVTGYPAAPFVGNVTLEFDEQDFPGVTVEVHREPKEQPYEFCTMDYFVGGTPVTMTAGTYAGLSGIVRVATTIGTRRQLRVKLDNGPEVTVVADHAEETSHEAQ